MSVARTALRKAPIARGIEVLPRPQFLHRPELQQSPLSLGFEEMQ